MKTLEIHELPEHIDELLCLLKDGETIEITDEGEVIAELVPIEKPERSAKKQASHEDIRAFWKEMDRIAQEIGKHSPEKVDAVDIVRDIRRDL